MQITIFDTKINIHASGDEWNNNFPNFFSIFDFESNYTYEIYNQFF